MLLGKFSDHQRRPRSGSCYWASGTSESFVGTQDKRSAALQQFWKDVFLGLSGNAKVLDLATGNGILIKFAMQWLSGHAGCTFTGVDLANVQPAWLTSVPEARRLSVNFLPGINMELLPFPDASFDAVVSQFGVEYSDVAASLKEARRVLKPRGTIALLVHEKNSLIVNTAKSELGQLDWLIDSALIEHGKRLCVFIANASTDDGRNELANDKNANDERIAFNDLLKEGSALVRDNQDASLLDHSLRSVVTVIQHCAATGNLDNAVKMLSEIDASWQDMRFRHLELVSAAYEPRCLQQHAERAGICEIRMGSIFDVDGRLLGFSLIGTV